MDMKTYRLKFSGTDFERNKLEEMGVAYLGDWMLSGYAEGFVESATKRGYQAELLGFDGIGYILRTDIDFESQELHEVLAYAREDIEDCVRRYNVVIALEQMENFQVGQEGLKKVA